MHIHHALTKSVISKISVKSSAWFTVTMCLMSAAAVARAEDAAPKDAPVEAVKAFSFDATLTGTTLNNVRGGLKKGGLGWGQFDMNLSWTGNDGWEAYGNVMATQNHEFSANYSGDAQIVSNIDLPQGVRLSELWLKKTSADQKWVTTLGFIHLNAYFDAQDVGGLFLNSSHGMGPEFAQSGASAAPNTAFGLIEEWRIKDGLSVRVGLFDAAGRDPLHDDAFAPTRLTSDGGVQYLIEGESDFKGGYVKLGHWAHTHKADFIDGSGRTRAMSGSYAQLSYTVTEESDPDQGLKGWLRIGAADAKVLDLDQYIGGGLVYSGPFKGRDHDQVGLAIALASFGGPYRASQTGTVTAETSYEVTYQAEIRPGFVVQPEVQYIKHPSGAHDIKDALVVGLQFRIGLETFR